MNDITAKVAHVRAHLRDSEAHHSCHWPGCARKVPPSAWGCARHWRMLPQAIRSKIWRAYRIKQEVSKTPSTAYVSAAREAQDWIRKYYGRSLAQG